MTKIFKLAKEYAAIIITILYSFVFLLVYVYEGSFNDYFGLKYKYISPNVSLIVSYSLILILVLSTFGSLLFCILFFPSLKSLKKTWWVRVLIVYGLYTLADVYFFKIPFFWYESFANYLMLISVGYLFFYMVRRSWMQQWIVNLNSNERLSKEQFIERLSLQRYMIKTVLFSPLSLVLLFFCFFQVYRFANLLGYKQANEQTKFQVLKNKPWMFLINEYDGTYYFKNYDIKKKVFGDSLIILKNDNIELFEKEVPRSLK